VTAEAVARTIQLILAPVVMISSAAVILNGLLAHYGEVNARVPAMNRERFDLAHLLASGSADQHLVDERLAEIDHQVPDLLERHLPGEVLERGVPADRSDAPDKLATGGWFDVDDRIELQHQVDMTPDDFVGLAFTSSYVRGGLDEANQQRFRDELRTLIDQHATDGQVSVPYHVDLWIGRRTGLPPQGPMPA